MNDSFIAAGMDTPEDDLAALRQLVLDAKQECNPGTLVIEVGSWAGRSARTIADSPAIVWCVDTWEGSVGDTVDDTERMVREAGGADNMFRVFCKNAGSRLFRSIFPCRGSSLTWASVWPFQVDLVFIDADHRYEAVKADIEAWKCKIRPGGIICGHDFGIFDGVNKAVRECFPDGVDLFGKTIWATTI